MGCKDCPFRNSIKVPYVGNKNAKIVIVGEAPAETEVRYKKPFIGRSGKLLFGTLNYVSNVSRKDVAILNAVKCKIIDNDKKNLTQALKHCRPFLEKAISIIKPKLIIAFGSTAAKQIIKDGNKILSKSGRFFWSDEFNCWVLISIHPSYALRNGVSLKSLTKNSFEMTKPEKLWIDTFKAIKVFIDKGYNYKGINTDNYVEAKEDDIDKIAKAKIIAFDYETNGLTAFNSNVKILSMAFSIEAGKSYVIIFDKDIGTKIKWVKKILTSNAIKVVASRPFEEIFTFAKFGFEVKQPVHDVLTMAHIINEENCQPYNLEEVASRYGKMLHIKDVAEGQRTTLETADRDLLIRYNGVDSDATFRSYITLRDILKKHLRLLNYYLNLIYKAQTIYSFIERRGFYINIMKVKQTENELKKIADELHSKALEYLPQSIIEKYKDNLSLSRSALIVDYLFEHKDGLKFKPFEVTEKTRKPTTTEAHLKNFESKSGFVKNLLIWKKATKILNTYFKQIYKSINPEDSKMYPHTLFTTTKTGRLTIANPTLQTIPQRGKFSEYIKKVFEAPEGYYFFDRDLSQSELRIMGWISNCKGIMKALNNGIDLHKNTANLVLGIPFDKITKEQRQSAKAIGFGFLYGASAKTFQRVAKNDYGVIMSLEEATRMREKFFKAYPEILEWHQKTINFARKYGYVESPLGRRRHLPFINSDDNFLRSEAERQAINFPIQSFSSDLNLISQIILQNLIKKYRIDNDIYTLFLVHDAMYGFVKEDKLKLAQKLTKIAMEELSKKYIKKYFNVEITYPIASDFSFGKNWAEMKELED